MKMQRTVIDGVKLERAAFIKDEVTLKNIVFMKNQP